MKRPVAKQLPIRQTERLQDGVGAHTLAGLPSAGSSMHCSMDGHPPLHLHLHVHHHHHGRHHRHHRHHRHNCHRHRHRHHRHHRHCHGDRYPVLRSMFTETGPSARIMQESCIAGTCRRQVRPSGVLNAANNLQGSSDCSGNCVHSTSLQEHKLGVEENMSVYVKTGDPSCLFRRNQQSTHVQGC